MFIGRFDRSDPLAELDFDQGVFNYVDNNPLNRIDLFGMIDVDGDGVDDGTLLDEVTVTAKRNNFNAAFGFDLMYRAHARNKQVHREASPYGQHFQDGGAIASGVLLAPVAAIGAAELGAGAAVSQGARYLANLRYASAGRWLLRKQLLKSQFDVGAGVGDLASQYVWNKGDVSKINLASTIGQTFIGGKLSFAANSLSAFLKVDYKLNISGGIDKSSMVDAGVGLAGNLASQTFNTGVPHNTSSVVKNIYSAVFNFYSSSITKPITESYNENQSKK